MRRDDRIRGQRWRHQRQQGLRLHDFRRRPRLHQGLRAAVRLDQHRRPERRDTARHLVQRHNHVRGGQRRRQRLRLQALGRVPGLDQEPRPKRQQRQPQRHVVRRPDTLGRRRHRRHDLRLRPAGRAAGQHSRRRRPAGQEPARRSERRNAEGRRGGDRRRLRHHGLHRRCRGRPLRLPVDPGGRYGRDRHQRRDRLHVHADRRRRGQTPQGAGGLRRRRGQPGIPPHQPPVRPGRRRRPAHALDGDSRHRHHHIYSFRRASRPGFHPGRVGVRGSGGGYCQHGGLGRDRRG